MKVELMMGEGGGVCVLWCYRWVFLLLFFVTDPQPQIKKQYGGVQGGEAAGAWGDSASKVGREDRWG